MIKYIDAGTARQHLTDRLTESALNNFGIKADADEVFRDIAENRLPVWMNELQTADVVKVRHGHWYVYGNLHYCSVCHEENDIRTPYCPWCGTKMDEVEDDND